MNVNIPTKMSPAAVGQLERASLECDWAITALLKDGTVDFDLISSARARVDNLGRISGFPGWSWLTAEQAAAASTWISAVNYRLTAADTVAESGSR